MDRIVVVENGVIAEAGTHDELIKVEGGLYQKLRNLQVSGFIQDK
jgi:ATP-binding cassette subfamily B protein/ATP-binding cassette subfamily C protein/ATP-binding cassette subfamily B multidrug efflux pump